MSQCSSLDKIVNPISQVDLPKKRETGIPIYEGRIRDWGAEDR